MKHLAFYFPYKRYPSMTGNQTESFAFLEKNSQDRCIIEAPTGTGKTAIGYTWLASLGQLTGDRFYLVPNKTLVDQVVSMHTGMKPMYGRNEHKCLYYPGQELRADKVPCAMLHQCPHRVLESGETYQPGAVPCPYLKQKHEALSGKGIIVATFSFYLYSVFFARQFKAEAVVVDEAHAIAKSTRSVLEFRITDYKLDHIIRSLEAIQSKQVGAMQLFLQEMKTLARKRISGIRYSDSLLTYDEIRELICSLECIDAKALRQDIQNAIQQGILDTEKDFDLLKQVETVIYDLRRYISALKLSLPPEQGDTTQRIHPLNFTFAFWVKDENKEGKVQYELVIRNHSVSGLIRAMLPDKVLAYSATIIDINTFSFETGIDGKYLSLGSDFPVEKTRIFMPTDTPNLAVKSRNKRDITKAIRLMVRSARDLALSGKRSVIIVVSDDERRKVLKFAEEESLETVSYGLRETSRCAMMRFRSGDGMCLVGTVANYSEGIDLPNNAAPVIFYFRPAYPHPEDPQTVFEERRYGGARWGVWNWRVMIDLLQVRGRNIRSINDSGVTILVSQQFRRFSRGALPQWLIPAYVGDKTFEECLKETRDLI